jgi:arylsulfatase A-like enzyme
MPAATSAPVARVRSVLIVTADSLRPDALGAYGSQPLPVSVYFDAWAKRAVRFERAYAAAPETRTSLPALLWGVNGPAGRAPSLAQRVTQASLAAMAVFSTHASLGDAVERAGFRSEVVPSPDSAQINAAAWQPLEHVAAHGGVLWVHYHDPHAPYTEVPGIDWGKGERARYLGLVTRMDRAFGALLARVPEDMAVIFASDHGEAFGEHGMYYHRSSLYDEQIRIPLVIAAPGFAPRAVPETAGLIDVYATALDLLGLPPTPEVTSRSLVPALLGAALPDAPYRATTWSVVEEGASAARSWVGVFYGRFKLLRRTDWNVDEVYDLSVDPLELEPNTKSALEMRSKLIELL